MDQLPRQGDRADRPAGSRAPAARPQIGSARYVGGYWTRSNAVEVDLVGAAAPVPEKVAFVGSIKWRERSGFTDDAGLDIALGPDEIVAACS